MNSGKTTTSESTPTGNPRESTALQKMHQQRRIHACHFAAQARSSIAHLLMHLVQAVHHGQDRVDHEGEFRILVIENFSQTFAFRRARTSVLRRLIRANVLIIFKRAREFLLPVFTKPDISRVVMHV